MEQIQKVVSPTSKLQIVNISTKNTRKKTPIRVQYRATSTKVDEKPKPKRKFPTLTWDDFQAEPNYGSYYYAHSFWRISFTYSVIFRSERAKVNCNAQCIFEKERSWAKPERKSQELLEHEQGHYYIGCLCALNFKRKVNMMSFAKSSYQADIQKIFRDNFQEYLAMEIRYDEETHHFLDQEAQKKWDKYLSNKIRELEAYWWTE